MKDYLDKFEKKLGQWLRPAPHLPEKITNWVAKNLWWIITIVVVLSVIGILSSAYSITSYFTFLGNAPSYAGIYEGVLYPDYWLFSTMISGLFAVVTTYIYYRAIPDLKALKKAGWRALYLVFIINLVRVAVGALAGLNIFFLLSTIIFGLISAAIGAYLLFELKPHFSKK